MHMMESFQPREFVASTRHIPFDELGRDGPATVQPAAARADTYHCRMLVG